jgi:tRNA(adenine34) deaminase
MSLALSQAREAADAGEVPVGAIVIDAHGKVIGRGRNAPVLQHDPTAHAEIAALREAAVVVGNYRLDGCTLYVTLEPCAMCCGAMLHARIARVVFGAADAKTGAAGSVIDLFAEAKLNHQTEVSGGVLGEECAELLQGFFRERRTLQRALRLNHMAHAPVPQWALRTPESVLPSQEELTYRTDLAALDGLRLYARVINPAKPVTDSDRWTLSPELSESLRQLTVEQDDSNSVDKRPARAWLCLHGARSWSWRFEAIAQALSGAGEPALLIDLPGFGYSDKPKRDDFHTLARHAAVITQWLDQLGIGNVVIVAAEDDLLAPQQIATALGSRVAAMALVATPLVARSDELPYPDFGHRAGPRALAKWVASATVGLRIVRMDARDLLSSNVAPHTP